jgi:hypothetical protein
MRAIVIVALGWSMAGASAAAWPLPVPSGAADVEGALVRLGNEVYQAKDFGLQATADGSIAISWLQGYDADGVSVRIERTLAGASALGFARASVGVDGAGFLLVGAPGLAASSAPSYPCGMTHLSTCSARQCQHCGDAPTCACQDVSGGGCDPLSRDYCDGVCGAGTCNGSVTNCGCAFAPPPVKTTGGAKIQRLQPADQPQ